MQLAKELGVADSRLYKWSRQYDSGVFSEACRKPQSSSDQEIARLTAELRRKTLEVEILKKRRPSLPKKVFKIPVYL